MMDLINQYVNIPPGILIAAAIAVAVLALTFPFVRRLLFSALSFLAGLVILVFSIWSMVFWTPTVWIFRRFIPVTLIAIAFEGLLKLIGSLSRAPLMRGDRLAAAQSIWPVSKFGFLYKGVPPDLRRPLVEDGKLIGGVSTTWLTDRYVTEGVPRSVAEISVLSFLEVFIPGLIYYVVSCLWTFSNTLSAVSKISAPVLERFPGAPPDTLIGWSSMVNSQMMHYLWDTFYYNAIIVLDWAYLSLGIALILIPSIVYAWRATKGQKYRMHTKDADVRWSYRAETREILNTTYNRQVELAGGYLKDGPVFPIGAATGILRLRGDLSAPTPGQTIALDQDSLFQHLLVLGGTGEGKTSGILRPLMKQLMPIKHYGMYVCDAKGVLWRDALKVAQESGRAKDVIIIGTAADQFGVDPIAELTPSQVVAALRTVLRQITTGSGDSFWPDMAANILRNVLTVALSYAQTDAGKKEFEGGLNPYSLWWAYLAVIDERRLKTAIEAVAAAETQMRDAAKAAKSEPEFREHEAAFKKLVPPDLKSSVTYLEGAWANMAKDTKSGILANVTQLLDGFSGAHALRERFASGRSEGTVRLSEALRGKIVLNAISSVEDGLPARLVIMLLKTTLYREARVREADWKAAVPSKNPQNAPCIVFMDEVQEIVSADPTSGLSDATFWNVARSSGLAGIFATQTIAALEQAIGAEASANFLQQSRSKIFFRSEDRATVEYACWCAGEFERDRVYEDGLYESVEFKELLTGENYLEPVSDIERPVLGFRLFYQMAMNIITFRQRGWDIVPSKPFIGTERSAPYDFDRDSTLAVFQANRQAQWREQDREWRYRTTGNTIVSALTPADVISMGRWHAYAHIQRAGAVRQDLVVINHVHA
jgi:hypothetical protein